VFKEQTLEEPVNIRLNVVCRNLDQLRVHPQNARIHTKQQIRQIAESIRAFGFTNPVLIDSGNRIIAGHGRIEAARMLGLSQVPTIQLESLNEEQIRAYVIADNRLAEKAGWDRSILAIELQYLMSLDCADFDVTITGFEIPEIDLILEEVNRADRIEEPVAEPNYDLEAVTKSGDLWLLGKHKILCGDALLESSYKTLMGARRATCVFTDPPYNVRIDGHATGNGAIHHREFAMASGEMSEIEFVSFLNTSLRLHARYSANNSVHYVCMDWRHAAELVASGKQTYDEFLNLCVWVKNSGGMGSFYRSQHELVLVFRNGKGPHRNNVQLGQFGRNRTNVWEYPGVQTLSKQGDEGNLLSMHPTVKPIAMVADALLDCTARGEIVLDGFLGSGTTLMAAERVGRICNAMELDPQYIDVAIRRWQSHTGECALHAQSGKRFDEVANSKDADHV
jgi:DNA modification methylase